MSVQTSYMLQFFWHDLSSNYNIDGQYFTHADSVDSKFILRCVLETIKVFQHHGLKTSFLVCNGCAANFTTIKATLGQDGAYYLKAISPPQTSLKLIYKSI